MSKPQLLHLVLCDPLAYLLRAVSTLVKGFTEFPPLSCSRTEGNKTQFMKTWHDASPLSHGVDTVFLTSEVAEVFVATVLKKAHLEAAECKGPGALITNYRCPVKQEQGRRQMEKGPHLAR